MRRGCFQVLDKSPFVAPCERGAARDSSPLSLLRAELCDSSDLAVVDVAADLDE